MKKTILTIGLCGVLMVALTGCGKVKEEHPKKEDFMVGYTLDDGRHMSFALNVDYKDTTLGDAVFKGDLSIARVIEELEFIGEYKDGGSRLYKYNKDYKKIFGDESFYMMVCNSTDGIKDIFVAKNRENLEDKCMLKFDDLEGVSMIIKKGTLTKSGATVIITDNSNRDNIYGSDYYLQQKENGKWVNLKTKNDLLFTSIGYHVGEDHILELKVNWEYHYGKLKKGNYRILKSTSESGEGTDHYITSEFTIE